MSGETIAALAVGLAFLVPTVWIWRWRAPWWARIERHEAIYGRPALGYQPFSALRTVPTLLGGIWFGVFAWTTLLDRFAPHVLDRLPLPLGFAILAWWVVVPGSVYLTGHPALLVPPGARPRQLAAAEGTMEETAHQRLEDLVQSGLVTGELRLQGDRSFAIVAVVGSLLLAGASLAFASSMGAPGRWGAVLFGIGVIGFGAQLIPGMMYLELTPQGFAFRQLLRTYRYPWKDVSAFFPLPRRRWSIGFTLTPTLNLPDSRSVPRIIRNIGAGGIQAYVKGDYGVSREELARLMNQWRDRFAGGESGRSR